MVQCRRVLKSLNSDMQKRAAGGHTWAMLLLGFAGIGFMAHRRRNGALA
jgi:MYXO-CTERM domain-containing protein